MILNEENIMQSNLLHQNMADGLDYNISVFQQCFPSLPYQYKQEDICSMEILIDESLSIFSANECFLNTYSNQSTHYMDYVFEKERAFVKKTILTAALEKKPFSMIHTIEKKETIFCSVHLSGIFAREQNGIPIYTLLLLPTVPQKCLEPQQSHKASSLCNTKYTDKAVENITPFMHSNNNMPYESISFYYDTKKEIFYFTKLNQFPPFSQEFFTFTLSQLKKTNWIHNDDKEHLCIFLQQYKNMVHTDMPLQTKIRILSKHKMYQWAFILLSPVYPAQNYIFGTVRQPAFVDEKEETDHLTGLYKRAAFEEYVQSSLCHPLTKQAAFIFIQLSNLEKIARAIGKPLKNMALQDIVKNIKRYFRQTDLLSKYNHNTIAIYMPNMHSKTALEKKLNAMQSIFDIPYGNAQKEYTTIGHMGISFYPENATSYKALSCCASKALQKAKESTKGCFQFYEKPFL